MTAITVTCPFLLQQWLVWMTVGIEGKSLLSSNFETEQNLKKKPSINCCYLKWVWPRQHRNSVQG